ncbi:N-acetyltransferase family protein [Cytobacillus sp. IB215316]|uniref:GNAT family N-acetyltransferase n=1 Tax=Cytobacillus sp. IB215316 TaxID=3097354 RepID=UPI002A0F0766|nr:N-acetyltransferase family protein [Cytobacillus sp. IB215316]MDX8361470.1 GNAT family N-acetyltransferase [Cytobacillus sp. IB215316]
MTKKIILDKMVPKDWEQVKGIYQEGINTGNATFEDEAPMYEEWDRNHLKECRFIARDGDEVLSWAALSSVSSRCVYNGVAEISVYVSSASQGRGIGSKLMDMLIKSSEEEGIWTLQAGIFPENASSLALHKKAGFGEIGIQKHIGKMQGRWRDVILLERRSRKVGV